MTRRVRVVVLQQHGSISSAKLHHLEEQHNERVVGEAAQRT
jgi:hypothetical protein